MIWKRLLASLCLCLAFARAGADTTPLTVFAAASLSDALAEIGALWTESTGQNLRVVAAGSATMARQIAAGAPADLVISANPEWMDWLAARGALLPGTRRDLLTNRLVLVAHGPDQPPLAGDPQDTIPERLSEGRLAVALTEAVPAGLYAHAALTHLGLWDRLRPRLAEADNVRAALAFVATGAAPLGIVYATDAQAEPRVSTIYTFPPDSHPAILYPAAVTANAAPEAKAFLDWLEAPAARAVFAAHCFGVPGTP